MPDNPIDIGEAACWLRDSRSDLGLAMAPKTRAIRYAHLCFHAQQAAEKALKAVLIAHAAAVPRTHDLAYLLDLLPKSIVVFPALLELPVLTKYAVQHRYPGQDLPVTKKDYEKAVFLAKETVAWCSHKCTISKEKVG